MSNIKCSRCGYGRFKTAKKTQGVRTLVRCRKCGQLHGYCYRQQPTQKEQDEN